MLRGSSASRKSGKIRLVRHTNQFRGIFRQRVYKEPNMESTPIRGKIEPIMVYTCIACYVRINRYLGKRENKSLLAKSEWALILQE